MTLGVFRNAEGDLGFFKPRSPCELTAKLSVKGSSMDYDSTIKVGFADDCESRKPWGG